MYTTINDAYFMRKKFDFGNSTYVAAIFEVLNAMNINHVLNSLECEKDEYKLIIDKKYDDYFEKDHIVINEARYEYYNYILTMAPGLSISSKFQNIAISMDYIQSRLSEDISEKYNNISIDIYDKVVPLDFKKAPPFENVDSWDKEILDDLICAAVFAVDEFYRANKSILDDRCIYAYKDCTISKIDKKIKLNINLLKREDIHSLDNDKFRIIQAESFLLPNYYTKEQIYKYIKSKLIAQTDIYTSFI